MIRRPALHVGELADSLLASIVNVPMLFLHGGFDVRTRTPAPPGATVPPEERYFAKTLIQPDGDVVTSISKLRLDGTKPWLEDVWQSHLRKVRMQLRLVKAWDKGLALAERGAGFLLMPIFVGLGHFSVLLPNLAVSLVLSILASVFLMALKSILFWWLRRRISDVLPGLRSP